MAEAAAGENVLANLMQLVLDIIPDNLLQGFQTDNDLQVIALAIFVGVVLLTLGKRSEKIAAGISIFADIVNKMMSFACRLLPLIVYFGILNMLLTSSFQITQIYRTVIAVLICFICVVASLLIQVRRRTEVPFRVLFKKQLPTLLINLSTSSQVAALPSNMKCCKEDFGIEPKLVDFALPLGIVVYMPCGAAFLGLTCCCVAPMSGIPIDAFFLVKLAVLAVIVAIAAPPIPGSAFAVLPILFSACGIPMDNYSIAIILATVLGYFLPMFNGYCIQLQLITIAHDLNLIDHEKLKQPLN